MNERSQLRIVACEGKDDMEVMQALANHAGIGDRLSFEEYASAGTLRKYLATLRSRPEFSNGQIVSVLLTRDADENAASAWQSVKDGLHDTLGVVLSEPKEIGVHENGVKFSGWIVAGNGNKGMIETLLLEAARESHPETFGCLDAFVECVGRSGGQALHEKARFHVWTILAQKPGAQDRLSLRTALHQVPPKWDSPVFSALLEVLKAAAE
jgi:hypothetical protein